MAGTKTIALVGRQNAGKTSLLMHLSGTMQHPVNFPGSSVERVEASATVGDTKLLLVDLPGISSTSAVSPDEELALSYITEGPRPDLVCVVMDASKLSVELGLLKSLSSLGVPLVCALNKADVAEQAGATVDHTKLGELLGVPVFPTNGATGEGVAELLDFFGSEEVVEALDLGSLVPDELAKQVTKDLGVARQSLTERMDGILLHPILGLPIFLILVFGVFQLIFTGAVPFMDLIEDGQGSLQGLVAAGLEPGALRSFLADGIIGGVGAILIFIPQIVILILCVSLLEGTGYMARAAFLLDRPLSKVGLSGRSFVPLASSFACAVPGILATRTIENERDRIATIVVAPLMSCSARLPVYVLLIGAFFPVDQAGLILLAMYMLGIVVACAVSWILRRTKLRGSQSLLMMEMPVYQKPSWRVVGSQVWTATRAFLVMAGTVIFATAIIIWLLSYYPRPADVHEGFDFQRDHVEKRYPQGGEAAKKALKKIENLESKAYREQSYLARMAKFIEPVFEPAGFDWRITVGVLSAFPARELVIPTMGILYGVGETDAGTYQVSWLEGKPDRDGLRARLQDARRDDGTPAFSPLIALALMVFFALCSQCMATLAAIKRETHSWKWPIFTFTYMTALAWVGAVLVFQVGSALGYA